MRFNDAQLKAVSHARGPLLIIAGAGAGKTSTIVGRILNLINSGVRPEEILAITFTNKAAREMRERVLKELQQDSKLNTPVSLFALNEPLPFVSTFHSLSVRILREFYKEANLKKSFSIYDRTDSKRAIKEAIKILNFDTKQYDPSITLNLISKNKNDGFTLKEYEQKNISHPFFKNISLIWKKYQDILSKENALDFDDLLVKANDLLKSNKNVRNVLQNRWKYIHIDEYQDTNTIQLQFIKSLIGKEKNICVVGDEDQCIYSWRNAKPENILRFEKDFPGAQKILLEQNYRSTKTIIQAANDIIKHNNKRNPKNLFTGNADGEMITVFQAMDAPAEANFITEKIQNLIDAGVNPKNIAILYRANFQSRALEEVFITKQIPYQVLGTRFFDRAEVKDALAYARFALNRDSIGDLKRIISTPPRGIGKKTFASMLSGKQSELPAKTQEKIKDFNALIDKLEHYIKTNSTSDSLRFILKQTGLEKFYKEKPEGSEKLENLKELVSVAIKYDSLPSPDGIEKLMEDVVLATDQDQMQKETDAVKLMTVHASKGLEFNYVFITGLEEGLFPHEKLDEETDEEEERRLFYVALTRAKKKIFLTYTFIRTIYGKTQTNTPSQFLEDLDDSYLAFENPPAQNNSVGLLDDIEF